MHFAAYRGLSPPLTSSARRPVLQMRQKHPPRRRRARLFQVARLGGAPPRGSPVASAVCEANVLGFVGVRVGLFAAKVIPLGFYWQVDAPPARLTEKRGLLFMPIRYSSSCHQDREARITFEPVSFFRLGWFLIVKYVRLT